ncbi:hypothetical protein LCGC14_0651060 [marine sediment metagenome]|uniref:Methyltransferase type 11 domain-containing protein n=1 Tax=marine sediment metagenome TaxID=412755 RepID=A0A0F9RG13_9ZZZZ
MIKINKQIYKLYYDMYFKRNNDRVLDIGCGAGEFLFHCSKDSCGVDIDETKLNIATENNLNVYKVDIDKQTLPFDDNYFDIVNTTSTLEHLWNPEMVLKEIYRVLKTNGKLIARVPNIRYWKWGFYIGTHKTPITKERIIYLIESSGLKITDIYYSKRGLFGLQKLHDLGININILKVFKRFCSYFKREQIMLEAVKENI